MVFKTEDRIPTGGTELVTSLGGVITSRFDGIGVLFTKQAGIAIEHVPYKTASIAVVDLVGGHIQTISTTLSTAAPQIRAARTIYGPIVHPKTRQE